MNTPHRRAYTPIADEDITLVFQGPWMADARRHVERSRAALPGARVVVSTFTPDDAAMAAMPDIDWVVSPDPGPLQPYKRGAHVPLNNVNRQIVSSGAGLARVKTRYAAKIRTDCTLRSRAFADLYARMTHGETASRRILASSIYTLHPHGIDALPFHLSDWFFFGPSERLSAYYDLPLMTGVDAQWFDSRRHMPGTHYFARRYRSRFAPEQYLTVNYAKRLGYATPSFLNETNETIEQAYLRFLSHECIVCEPHALALEFEKYAHVSRSHYQYFNCMWERDWLELFEDAGSGASRPDSSSLTRSRARHAPASAHRRTVVRAIRRMDFLLPVLAATGLMCLVGDMLGFYRKLTGLKTDA